MALRSYISQLNNWGKEQLPFFFLVDFELEQPLAWPLSEIGHQEVLFDFEGFSNTMEKKGKDVFINKSSGSFEVYKAKFDVVHHHLQQGNTFLVNLTSKTEIFTSAGLRDIFHASKAKYRMVYKDQWVVFSPETFLRISDGIIETCPMKGTIDANLPDAEALLLNDPKELAEHVTVVDLLRNDLSMFARDVKVERFRFAERIFTQGKDLIQTSSKITGKLPPDYASCIGEMLVGMLPAGSVSGAPKAKTCEIIQLAEQEKRGYYTGVAGYFDGKNLNSCVLIRFIEKQNDRLYYKSGGGITAQSAAWQEYQELIDKIYVPATGVHQDLSK